MSQLGTGLLVVLGILAAPLLLVWSFHTLGVWGAIVSAPLFYLGVIPFMDAVAALIHLPALPHFDEVPRPLKRALLLAAAAFHIAFLVLFVSIWKKATLLPFESLFLMLSFGWVQSGSGLVLAHELIHERGRFFRILGLWSFSSLGQAQQYWFHNQSHHRLAGSERDASTAPLGLSFYGYLARQPFAMFQLAVSDLKGSKRLKRATVLLFYNLLPIAVLSYAGSFEMAFWYFISNLIVELTFECFNYVTHYGCTGENPKAWGCDFYFSNWTTLGLADHIEHHGGHKMGAAELVLPYNIHYMMVLALLPPLFMYSTNRKIQHENAAVGHA